MLLNARKNAESSLNSSTEELRKTLQSTISSLNDQLTKAQTMLTQLNDQRGKLQTMLENLEENPVDPSLADMAVQLLLSGSEAQLQLGEFQLESGRTQLESGKAQLDAAQEEYDSAREEALKSANLDQLLNMNTLKQLISAQNFSMPAGYIEGGEGDDNRYIVKVGDTFDSADTLKSMVLCSIDGIGDVRLSDVADVKITDNADDSYAKVGGNRAVLLSIYKSSTASTSAVSSASTAAMQTLMDGKDGLHLTTIMDRGLHPHDRQERAVQPGGRRRAGHSGAGTVPEGPAPNAGRRHLDAAERAVCHRDDVFHRHHLQYPQSVGSRWASACWWITRSLSSRTSTVCAGARTGPAGFGSGCPAGIGFHHLLDPDHHLRIFADDLLHRHGARTAHRYGTDYHLQPAGLADRGVDRGALRGFHRTAHPKEVKHPLFDKLLDGYEKALRFCLKVKALPLGLAIGLLVLSVWRIATMGIVMIPIWAATSSPSPWTWPTTPPRTTLLPPPML